ncbi:hypothetical protein ACIBG8_03245 [Nonomuraea sp. NPDC050556]|uniref:hypothetical protein n=1 Tax=Nonomuraea sp. NPDC050556 TaxID=3364369 RepID=UPI00378BC787
MKDLAGHRPEAAVAQPCLRRCDPTNAWTVEEPGAHAGLSRASFARRFTAIAGRPPLAYLTWWRYRRVPG